MQALQVMLPSDQRVCPICEKPMPMEPHHVTCELCRTKARLRTHTPEYKVKVQARIQPVIDWMRKLKSGMVCVDCRMPKDPERMDWDHLPGTTKLKQVSWFVHHGDREGAMREMAKCELVCDSCHTKRGLRRGQTKYYGRQIGVLP
jgi:hypothetical protein